MLNLLSPYEHQGSTCPCFATIFHSILVFFFFFAVHVQYTKGEANNGIAPPESDNIHRFPMQDSEPAGLNSIKDYAIPDVRR